MPKAFFARRRARCGAALGLNFMEFLKQNLSTEEALAKLALAHEMVTDESGSRSENIERAINLILEALNVITFESDSPAWMAANLLLAAAYIDRSNGSRTENFAQASQILNKVIALGYQYNNENGLANALSIFGNLRFRQSLEPDLDRVAKMKEAIGAYEQALQYFHQLQNGDGEARQHVLLAQCYAMHAKEDIFNYPGKIIYHAGQALTYFTYERDKIIWARLILLEGAVYAETYSSGLGERLKTVRANVAKALSILESAAGSVIEVNQDLLQYVAGGIMASGGETNPEVTKKPDEGIQETLSNPSPQARMIEHMSALRAIGLKIMAERTSLEDREIEEMKAAQSRLTSLLEELDKAGQKTGRSELEALSRVMADEIAIRVIFSDLLETVLTLTVFPKTGPITIENPRELLADHFDGNFERLMGYAYQLIPEKVSAFKKAVEESIEFATNFLNQFPKERDPSTWAHLKLGLVERHLQLLLCSNTEEERAGIRRQAEEYFAKSFHILRANTNPAILRKVCRAIGTYLFFHYQRWLEAANLYDLALQAQESIYKNIIGLEGQKIELEEVADMDFSLVLNQAYALSRLEKADQAIAVLEKWRARQLAEQLRINTSALSAAAGAQDSIVQQIATPVRPLVYLVVTSRGSLTLISQGAVPPIAIWNDELSKGKLLALLLSPDESDSYYDGIANKSANFLPQILNKILPILGQALMKPIADKLQEWGATQVVLIPCGLLTTLPLHAAPYDDGRCLLMNFDVNYAYSAQSFHAASQRLKSFSKKHSRLVGIANTRGDLPDAEVELHNIASIFLHSNISMFSEASVTALLKESGTRDKLIEALSGATHLHFACHGIFSDAQPLDSKLLLAAGQELTLRNILYDPKLNEIKNLRLVVMSACQTALSDFQNLPDEMTGLPAGFLQKGVVGVVGTLWPVDDLSTSLLMTRFYERLLEDRQEVATALREAQVWLCNLSWDESDKLIQEKLRLSAR